MPHTVNSAILEFGAADEVAQQSEGAQSRHHFVLNVLREQMGGSKPIAQIRRSDIDAVLAEMRRRGRAESTLNTYRATLRPFGRWLLDNGYVKRNPASHLKNAKIAPDRSKRKPLTSDQLKQVIEKAERRHPCDGMTVSLLFWTGCRQSEIRGLKWGDVNLQDLTLEVYRPKVKKSLTCPIPAQLAEDLTKWQAWVEGRYGPIQPEWYVVPARFHRGFVNGIPQKITPDWPLNLTKSQGPLTGAIKRLLVSIGITDMRGKGSHTIRRTAANLILAHTGDIRAAQHLLGHGSVTMTERYLDADAQAAKYGATIREWTI